MKQLSQFFLAVLLLTLSAASWAEWKTLNYTNATYVGNTLNGQPNGQGTYTFGIEQYVGEFKDGLFNGQGTWTHPFGEKYVGEWKNHEKNGQGTFTWPTGTKYVGEYRDGKRWNGVSYDEKGLVAGTYEEGVFRSTGRPNTTLASEPSTADKKEDASVPKQDTTKATQTTDTSALSPFGQVFRTVMILTCFRRILESSHKASMRI